MQEPLYTKRVKENYAPITIKRLSNVLDVFFMTFGTFNTDTSELYQKI
ncbi:hypothetical protein HMPREF0673_02785 [Leyella stercorea DSM 18206]|uniref:Uncharacterized protein n=1 Tax=Leyella stercorea DSM 18206 TaxID=1002367 RepID=G6B1L1_9BACT|nr:hypothetical protein HMPREF0673_02785 [Leyella stercorea DSM 18206]